MTVSSNLKFNESHILHTGDWNLALGFNYD